MAPAVHPVVIVGAGPGAADLITVRGARRLAAAHVVLCDALVDPRLQALAPSAQWIDVGKRGFTDSTGQARIDALLVKHALAGRKVVRLKGGDPSVFGRLDEELQALAAAGLEVEVVPGVTAALAAAATAQKPLTRRGNGRTVRLTTAMTDSGIVQPHSKTDHQRDGTATEVFYMAGRQLAALARRLQLAGWPADTAASVVSRAGWPDALASAHTVASLPQAAAVHAGRPTMVTVGVGARPVGIRPPKIDVAGGAHGKIAAAAVAPIAQDIPDGPGASQAGPHPQDTPEDPS